VSASRRWTWWASSRSCATCLACSVLPTARGSALDTGAAAAAQGRSRDDVDFFSVRIELRLFAKKDHHADLDNYVKPILDSMAKHGVFGPTLHRGSSMTGDERVDHLELTRRRVAAQADAGVLIEVWSLN